MKCSSNANRIDEILGDHNRNILHQIQYPVFIRLFWFMRLLLVKIKKTPTTEMPKHLDDAVLVFRGKEKNKKYYTFLTLAVLRMGTVWQIITIEALVVVLLLGCCIIHTRTTTYFQKYSTTAATSCINCRGDRVHKIKVNYRNTGIN